MSFSPGRSGTGLGGALFRSPDPSCGCKSLLALNAQALPGLQLSVHKTKLIHL
jgi:hypothetical protein